MTPESPTRVIARLDIKSANVVKGIQLEGLRVVGQPGPLAHKYYEQGADEILYIDVVASLYGRNSIFSVVREAAREIFIPLTVGGGIRTIDNIVEALRNGADKVAINTAAIQRPHFLKEASQALGSQCIVLSIHAKWRDGHWEALTENGRETSGMDVLEWAARGEELGAGEILITSVDREGTRKGFDLELVRRIRERVSIPVIAGGGAGNSSHVIELFDQTHADAVCCASIFHYDTTPIPVLKADLAQAGKAVRT